MCSDALKVAHLPPASSRQPHSAAYVLTSSSANSHEAKLCHPWLRAADFRGCATRSIFSSEGRSRPPPPAPAAAAVAAPSAQQDPLFLAIWLDAATVPSVEQKQKYCAIGNEKVVQRFHTADSQNYCTTKRRAAKATYDKWPNRHDPIQT